MVKQRNKILSTLLLGIFSLQMVLPFFLSLSLLVVTLLQRHIIDKNRDNTAYFTQLSISEKDQDITFLNEEEFRYKGVLYDIDKIKRENGAYVITALPDQDEATILKVNTTQNESAQKEASTVAKSAPFFFLFFEAAPSLTLVQHWYPRTIFKVPTAKCIAAIFPEIVTPPPQFEALYI